MKCPRCSLEFNVVQRQIIMDDEYIVQSTQLFCPRCHTLIDNWPQKIHHSKPKVNQDE